MHMFLLFVSISIVTCLVTSIVKCHNFIFLNYCEKTFKWDPDGKRCNGIQENTSGMTGRDHNKNESGEGPIQTTFLKVWHVVFDFLTNFNVLLKLFFSHYLS